MGRRDSVLVVRTKSEPGVRDYGSPWRGDGERSCGDAWNLAVTYRTEPGGEERGKGVTTRTGREGRFGRERCDDFAICLHLDA